MVQVQRGGERGRGRRGVAAESGAIGRAAGGMGDMGVAQHDKIRMVYDGY